MGCYRSFTSQYKAPLGNCLPELKCNKCNELLKCDWLIRYEHTMYDTPLLWMHSFQNLGSQGILQILPVLSGAAAITSKRWWMVRMNASDTFDNQLAWRLQYNLLYLHAIHDHMSSNINRASRNDRKHINFPHTRAHAPNTWNTIHHLWLCCNYRPCIKLHRTGSLIGCEVTPVPLNLLNNTLTHLHTFFSISTPQRYLYSKKRVVLLETQQIMSSISPTHWQGPAGTRAAL